MEVTVVSTEAIKPSLSSTNHLKPHKLCLFDQLTPMTYIIGVLFYPISDPNFDAPKTLAHLKKCLSKTLSLYYPYSGRNDGKNLHVSDFDAGVLFLEAKVNSPMSDFLKVKDVDSLNHLVPFAPFRRDTTERPASAVPLLAVQVSAFSCGGLALGASSCHKNADGTSTCFLINSWAALCRGSHKGVIRPSLPDAAEVFPPMEEGLPEKYSALMDRLWFTEGSFVTRRFVFSAEAVEALRVRARSERAPRPSRNDAVSCFLWKHATLASWAASGRKGMSFAGPAVNVRPRMRTPSAANAVGNLFWWGMAVVHAGDDLELSEMVVSLKDAMEGFDRDFLKEVKEGREGTAEIVSQLELMLQLEPEEPFIIGFTNWRGFFNEVDFGWGKPHWVGAMGKVGPAFRNLVVLVESQWGRGMEAFIALDAKEMAVLENDPNFLAFASLNPGLSSL